MEETQDRQQANQTHFDDMLLEMITPKVKKIEEKFSRGEGLEQEDINTLLLKSQYNHINHLNIRLDELTNSVIALRADFNTLRSEFGLLKSEFRLLEEKIAYTIQKALNKNMLALISVMGVFVILSKIIDKF